MKTVLTLAILAISTITSAMPIKPPVKKDMRVLSFEAITEGAEIALQHSRVLMYPSLEVNYATDTVSLKYLTAPRCKKGFVCPAVMQSESIDLPIISKNISDDGCSVTVIAKRDQRPVDGIMQQITVDDFSNSTCRFFVKPISNLIYETSYYNRIDGFEVHAVSKLKADLFNANDVEPVVAGEFYSLTSGKYVKGFGAQKMSSGTLTINEKTINLDIMNESTCPVGAMCFVGPTFFNFEFNIDSREIKGCVEVIKASAMTMGAGQKLVVKSYAHSPCDIMPEHIVTAEYTSTVVAPNVKGPSQIAQFFFNYAIVPMHK